MKKIIIVLFCLVCLPLVSLAWTGTSGSTETPAGYYDNDTMNKLSFDQGQNAWQVTITSFGCTITATIGGEVLNSSDTLTHTRLQNIFNQLISSVTVVQKKYEDVASSGTSGLLTGVNVSTITVTGNVDTWSFTYLNMVNPMSVGTINVSMTGKDISFFDGYYDNQSVPVPQPITFIFTLPVESTMTYKIITVE